MAVISVNDKRRGTFASSTRLRDTAKDRIWNEFFCRDSVTVITVMCTHVRAFASS